MNLRPPPSLRRSFSAADIDEAVRLDRILTLSLKLPVGCNLNCAYCYGSRETGDMRSAEVLDAVRQARELGARSVSILGEGEPLLYEADGLDLFDLIDRINGLGLPVVLFTNNTLIDEAAAARLLAQDTVVIAKWNSPDPRVQERLTGRADDGRVLRGLGILRKAGFNKTSPSRLGVHSVIVQDNERDIPGMWRMCRSENIVPYFQVFVPPPRQSANHRHADRLSVPSERLKTLFQQLAELDRSEYGFDWDPDSTYPIAGMGCGVIRSGCAVDGFGRVKLCGYLDHVVGDLRQEPLEAVLRKDIVRKIRRCDYQAAPGSGHFYGCRTMAFNMTGDRFAEDPMFWGK